MERLCCPFVRYTLEIEPNHGPFRVRMTGDEETQSFLRIAFESARYFKVEVAQAAGLAIPAGPEIDSVGTMLETAYKLNEQYAEMANLP